MIIDKCVDLINVHQRVDQQTVSIHSGKTYITFMLVHYMCPTSRYMEIL